MLPPLTMRLTIIGGQTDPDDWSIYAGDTCIGRINLAVTTSKPIWLWSCCLPTRPQKDDERGRAETLPQAKAAFKQAFERIAVLVQYQHIKTRHPSSNEFL